jgi:hypothetical protein
MAILFVRPSEVQEFTPLGGNVDVDKFLPCILDVQETVILPLIGQELYDEIALQIENSNLTNLNQDLLNGYLKKILRYQSFSEFVEISGYVVANGGIFKHQPKDAVIVEKNETQYLANIFRSKAQTHIQRCEQFLQKNNLGFNYSWGYVGENAGYYFYDNKIEHVKVSAGWHL